MPLAKISHLPTKKRKPSTSTVDTKTDAASKDNENKSNSNDHEQGTIRTITILNDQILKEQNEEQASSSLSKDGGQRPAKQKVLSEVAENASTTKSTFSTTTNTTSKSNICPSRLPSKKRKGSYDSQFAGANHCHEAAASAASSSQAQSVTSASAECHQLQVRRLRKDSAEESADGSFSSDTKKRNFSIDISSVNGGATDGTYRKNRTNSLSSLDEDLTRRKWSHDSTLPELSPVAARLDAAAAVAGNACLAGTSSNLPKFYDILVDDGAGHAPPILPESLLEVEESALMTVNPPEAAELSTKAPPVALPKFDDVLLPEGDSGSAATETVASSTSSRRRQRNELQPLVILKAPPAAVSIPKFSDILSGSQDGDAKPPAVSVAVAGGEEAQGNQKVGQEYVQGNRKESLSLSMGSACGSAGAEAAMEHLDALFPKGLPKKDDDTESSEATFASSGQKLLFEAIMMTTGGGSTAGVAGTGGRERIDSVESQLGRERFESVGSLLGRERFDSVGSLLGRERFGSIGSVGGLMMGGMGTGRDRLGSLGSALEAGLFHGSNRRERLESWGAMSDLSGILGATSALTVAAAESLLHAATADDNDDNGDDADDNNSDASTRLAPAASGVPSRIPMGRDRLGSLASLSEASLTGLPIRVEGIDITIDLQAFVSATVESMGDQLAEIATAVEIATGAIHEEDATLDESEMSSTVSPVIGTASGYGRERRKRNRSLSINSHISVDPEALAVAVDAANAAAASLNLAHIGEMSVDYYDTAENSRKTFAKSKQQRHAKDATSSGRRSRRQLPLSQRIRAESDPSYDEENDNRKPPGRKSSISEKEASQIRERARAAASARNPLKKQQQQHQSGVSSALIKPLKKRVRRTPPSPEKIDLTESGTPKSSNRGATEATDASLAATPPLATSSSAAAAASTPAPRKQHQGDRANQKWECMFDHLIKFIEERREKETEGIPEDEKDLWVWDGNVPTNHKTEDGKALGRWVNNQRTAKTKGSLKEERIRRLEDAGLKWSVLSSSSWNETLNELRKFVEERTQDGSEWDGNVPSSYQVKTAPGGQFGGEDRNLGRWVNRQRSLKSAGKLRKDRQLALEKLGLKWSMYDNGSWEFMFDRLVTYVNSRISAHGTWDGNVPANYKTLENPPRALGRWVNRQREGHAKKKLKPEYEEQLEKIGLKWSIHTRVNEDLLAEENEMFAKKVSRNLKKGAPVDRVVNTTANEKPVEHVVLSEGGDEKLGLSEAKQGASIQKNINDDTPEVVQNADDKLMPEPVSSDKRDAQESKTGESSSCVIFDV